MLRRLFNTCSSSTPLRELISRPGARTSASPVPAAQQQPQQAATASTQEPAPVDGACLDQALDCSTMYDTHAPTGGSCSGNSSLNDTADRPSDSTTSTSVPCVLMQPATPAGQSPAQPAPYTQQRQQGDVSHACLAPAQQQQGGAPPQTRAYKTVTLAVSAACPKPMRRTEWSADDFAICNKMYEGAISAVFHAVDKQSNITVALKVYKRHKLEDFERTQVSREIRLHSALVHESIIGMYAAWKDAFFVYLALEWAPGGDVHAYMRQNGGSISEELLVPLILEPFMSGLKMIHSMGLIHRDIKPENILLTNTFQIKIADFGLSIDSKSEVANTRLGTIDYLAPEIVACPMKDHPWEYKEASDAAYTSKVDCWSVGVLAYELLVGTAPFASETLHLIRTKEVLYPEFLSAGAVDFISVAMSRDPEARWSIDQLLEHPWVQSLGRHRHARAQPGVRLERMATCPESLQHHTPAVGNPALAKPMSVHVTGPGGAPASPRGALLVAATGGSPRKAQDWARQI